MNRRSIAWGSAAILIIALATILTIENNERQIEEILVSPATTSGILRHARYEKGKPPLADYYFEVEGRLFKSSKGDGK
jgi:hypothetical protein